MKIEEALKLSDPLEIRKEIADRHALIREMVGWLYPRIVAEEIIQLSDLLSNNVEIALKSNHLQSPGN